MFRHSEEALDAMKKGNADCAILTEPEVRDRQETTPEAELAVMGLAQCVVSLRHNNGTNSKGEPSPSFA